MIQPTRCSDHSGRAGSEGKLHGLATALAGAYRALRLYPEGNPVAKNALDHLVEASDRILEERGRIGIAREGALLMADRAGPPADLTSSPLFKDLSERLQAHTVARLELEEGLDREAWRSFLLALAGDPDDSESGGTDEPRLVRELEERGVRGIHVTSFMERSELPEPPTEVGADTPAAARERARQVYQDSVGAVKSIFTQTLDGRVVDMRQARSVAHPIVDSVLHDQVSLMAMTILRDYDEYTYTHSVNVAVFSSLIGHEIDLARDELRTLGVAALLHDVGKTRLDPEILNKEGRLTDEEFRQVKEHPVEGLLLLSGISEPSPGLLEAMLVAYEHHLRTDLSGYPRVVRPRRPGLFSRIVAVADTYDALTSNRCYREALRPDQVVVAMRDDASFGLDPLLVRALIQVTGLYPVGTVVLLDTKETGVVMSPSSDATQLHRPTVKIVKGADGRWLDDPPTVDLTDRNPGTGRHLRSILGAKRPDEAGIPVARYVA